MKVCCTIEKVAGRENGVRDGSRNRLWGNISYEIHVKLVNNVSLSIAIKHQFEYCIRGGKDFCNTVNVAYEQS